MQIEKLKTEQLISADYNSRKDLKSADAEYEKLKHSIEQFGYVEPVIWDKTTGRIIGGHQHLKLTSSKTDYEDVADEIYRLHEQKQKALVENAGRDEQRKRISDMSAFLQEQPTAITEYDEQLVRRLIEKVTVYEDRFTVEFKSGVTVDVED